MLKVEKLKDIKSFSVLKPLNYANHSKEIKRFQHFNQSYQHFDYPVLTVFKYIRMLKYLHQSPINVFISSRFNNPGKVKIPMKNQLKLKWHFWSLVDYNKTECDNFTTLINVLNEFHGGFIQLYGSLIRVITFQVDFGGDQIYIVTLELLKVWLYFYFQYLNDSKVKSQLH